MARVRDSSGMHGACKGEYIIADSPAPALSGIRPDVYILTWKYVLTVKFVLNLLPVYGIAPSI